MYNGSVHTELHEKCLTCLEWHYNFMKISQLLRMALELHENLSTAYNSIRTS